MPKHVSAASGAALEAARLVNYPAISKDPWHHCVSAVALSYKGHDYVVMNIWPAKYLAESNSAFSRSCNFATPCTVFVAADTADHIVDKAGEVLDDVIGPMVTRQMAVTAIRHRQRYF
jgi:hypothetical protein